MWGNKCWVCGEKATATDHVKSLFRGGSHWPANLRPICKPCNSKKGRKAL
jgi:5-methylcytosine-specific restriction endonuclease McrA